MSTSRQLCFWSLALALFIAVSPLSGVTQQTTKTLLEEQGAVALKRYYAYSLTPDSSPEDVKAYQIDGIPHDDGLASRWLKTSAECGNATAQRILGTLMLVPTGNDYGISKLADGIRWLNSAAAKGEDRAKKMLEALIRRANSSPGSDVAGISKTALQEALKINGFTITAKQAPEDLAVVYCEEYAAQQFKGFVAGLTGQPQCTRIDPDSSNVQGEVYRVYLTFRVFSPGQTQSGFMNREAVFACDKAGAVIFCLQTPAPY